MTNENHTNARHILSLSGGKDSAALAIFMKGKIQNVEYVFCDTGEELKVSARGFYSQTVMINAQKKNTP